MMNATRMLQRSLMWGIGACLVTSAALRIGAHADAAVAATEKPAAAIAPPRPAPSRRPRSPGPCFNGRLPCAHARPS